MQKLTPTMFARWMTILREVSGSVLWLLSGDDETNKRLLDAAAGQGVARERILFAGKTANPQHLARIGLADLFLDTTPYGAHSTAADALTIGPADPHAGGAQLRFALLRQRRLGGRPGDLICATPEDYVRRAIAFGRDRASLAPYRDKLVRERDASVLRDIPALTRASRRRSGECRASASAARRRFPT